MFVELCTTTILGYPFTAKHVDNLSVVLNSLVLTLDTFDLDTIIVNANDILAAAAAVPIKFGTKNKMINILINALLQFSF